MRHYWMVGLILLTTGCQKKLIGVVNNVNGTGPISLVVAGQSNGVSGDGETLYSETGMVQIVDPTTKRVYVPTESDPAHYQIAWLLLGDKLAAMLQRPIHFWNCAVGSTSSAQWADDNGQLMSDLKCQIRTHKPSAVLWVQGESDYIFRFSASDSYAYLRHIIDVVHGIDPDILFVIAITGDADGNYNVPVIAAQRQLIREGLAVQGGDLQGIRLDGSDDAPGDATGYHLSLFGKKTLANQMYDCLMRYKPWSND